MIVRAPDRSKQLAELKQKLKVVSQLKPILMVGRPGHGESRYVETIGDLEAALARQVPGTDLYAAVMRRIENAYVAMPEGKIKVVAGKAIDRMRIREIIMLSSEYDRIRVIDSDRANAIRAEITGMLDTAETGSALRGKVLEWMAKHPKE